MCASAEARTKGEAADGHKESARSTSVWWKRPRDNGEEGERVGKRCERRRVETRVAWNRLIQSCLSSPLLTVMEGGAPAVSHLPDELVVEILAKLPAKSLCRFKCVSRSWNRLICDPRHRAKLAQTLTGFFVTYSYPILSADAAPRCGFVGLSPHGGKDGPPLVDTTLSFLPPSCGEMELLHSSNGLLLLLCWGAPQPHAHPFYVVCNPATREWLALPQPSQAPGQDSDEMMGKCLRTRATILGFDTTISLHFHVFQLVEAVYMTDFKVKAVEIYSSETGRWILRECGWGTDEFHLFDGNMTYLNGILHFTLQGGAVAMVDTKGEVWRVNQVSPQYSECYGYGFVGHCQGRLLHVFDDNEGDSLSVNVLEDRGREEWTFKNNISKADLFGPRKSQWGPDYDVVAFHPEADLIFFYDLQRNRLISYDMTYREVHVISAIGGEMCSICTILGTECSNRRFLPYIPLYSRTLVSPIVN